jgi:hypothetical protein
MFHVEQFLQQEGGTAPIRACYRPASRFAAQDPNPSSSDKPVSESIPGLGPVDNGPISLGLDSSNGSIVQRGPDCSDRHLSEPENSSITTGKDKRLGPDNASACRRLKRAEGRPRDHERKPAARGDQRRSFGNSPLHTIDGAQGNTVEAPIQSIGAPSVNLRRDAGNPDRLLKECSLLALRLGKCHKNLLAANCDGDPGKTGPRTEVKQRGNTSRKSLGTGDRLDEMTGKDAARLADCAQVYPLVPANKERKIEAKLFILRYLKRAKPGFFPQLAHEVFDALR